MTEEYSEEDCETGEVVGEYHCLIPNGREEQDISSCGLITLDYTVNPIWYNDRVEFSGWNNVSNRENPELENCDEIANNENLIYDQDIPVLGEEEVVSTYNEDYEISQDCSLECSSETENLRIQEIQETDSNTNSSLSSPHPRSLLKINQTPYKFKQTLMINKSLLKSNQRQLQSLSPSNLERSVSSISSVSSSLSPSILVSSSPSPEVQENPPEIPKFRQTVKFSGENLFNHKKTIKMIKNKIKAMNNKMLPSTKSERDRKRRKRKHKKHQRNRSTSRSNLDLKNINILEPKSPSANLIRIHSGEIVKVDRNEVDSDVEIDVESDNDYENSVTIPMDPQLSQNVVQIPNPEVENEKLLKLMETNKPLYDLLASDSVPVEELKIEPHQISDLETFMISEFFKGKGQKTPERYLKIRNHILGIWHNNKPNYLSKTQARQGLKNCGDVNAISKVHTLLEQIGTINYGCNENFQYIRPLKVVWELLESKPKNRNTHGPVHPSNISNLISEKRQRIRNYNSFGHNENEDILLNDANYTIQHMESVLRSEPEPSMAKEKERDEDSDSMINRIKSRTKYRKDFELVKCQRFSRDNIAPFKVSISLSTLLCLYLHALSSKLEIMGFLGGHISKSVGRDKLSLTRYKPTRTSSQSGINCEMCPISQVEQSSILTREGYELLGWFHSHPLFPPNPSRTDLRTQTEMQMQFAANNPFIGFILSCVDLEFKCIYMCSDAPFELEVDIVKDFVDIKKEIKDIFDILDKYDSGYKETLEKFIHSGNSLLRQFSINECIENIIKDFI